VIGLSSLPTKVSPGAFSATTEGEGVGGLGGLRNAG